MPLLDLPTLLVVATRNGVIEPKDEAELAVLRPALVRDAGHMISRDDFGGFLEAVDPFLRAQQEG